ncbi:MAG: RNA polymerase sigma factor [Planctomycetota bacterium]
MSETLDVLLDRCLAGDPDAFGTLVMRFQDSAFDLARALLDDAHLAEDAVQAAFLTASQRLPQLRLKAAFPGWFRQIVRTQAHRILRKRRERPAELPGEPESPLESPSVAAEREEMKAAVRRALAALPKTTRETAERVYLDEWPPLEVAVRYRLPAGTVKRRLHDVRRRLRGMLLGVVADEKRKRPGKPPSETGPAL